MIYIDSDGVMFDFDYWKNSINPNANSDNNGAIHAPSPLNK